MERINTLHQWLQTQLGSNPSLSAPIGDASSRRYFRLLLADGTSRIAMDAPPERNDLRSFTQIATLLKPVLRVPSILAQDLTQGFLLLDDLGDIDLQTALAALQTPPHPSRSQREQEDNDRQVFTQAEGLYRWVIQDLIALQKSTPTDSLPVYSAEIMVDDLNRFAEWYADKHLGKPLQGDDLAVWERSRALLVARAQAQGKVPVHFDFHCRNLIVGHSQGPQMGLAERVGIIDFQDARLGPITYDLASLLKDMYVHWPESLRLELAIRFWESARLAALPVSPAFDAFYAEFEIMGVFRQIRTLGTFARLAHRDGKAQYIADMPIALDYLRETCARYTELHPLYKLINKLTDYQVSVGYTF
ncbi:aminoglycoside phosphotransferase family protein [Chitinimonas sp. BJB300]|uniref:aminoglycoside phosphotransferase family protein n=1 Tax=Chitinimonas sp. BJB300 TaxID=1559339 RepID=UPI0013047444|nr:phosphotransferase [Chitinimonas sp. BJB300]